MDEINKIHHKDWMLNDLPDKSVNLILADPPYYKVKGDFDFVWKNFDDYLKDVERWAIECKRVLADNGTLYWYGDAKNIAYAQILFDKHFNLLNSLVFQKQLFCDIYGNLRGFAPQTERCLVYTNGNELFEVNNNILFKPSREYLFNKMKQKGVKYSDLDKILFKAGLQTKTSSHAKLFCNPEQKQGHLITEKQYNAIKKYLELEKDYCEILAEYKLLRDKFENEKRFFDNSLKLQEIIQFGKAERHDHETVKPESITIQIIKVSSRPQDLILIPFAGSGTECAMAAKEGRRFIGFDTELKHVEYANKRAEQILCQPQLF